MVFSYKHTWKGDQGPFSFFYLVYFYILSDFGVSYGWWLMVNGGFYDVFG
jgi:hypothetical protein